MQIWKHAAIAFVSLIITYFVALSVLAVPFAWLLGPFTDQKTFASLFLVFIVATTFFSCGASVLNLLGSPVILSTILLAAGPTLLIFGATYTATYQTNLAIALDFLILCGAFLVISFCVAFAFAHSRKKMVNYFLKT